MPPRLHVLAFAHVRQLLPDRLAGLAGLSDLYQFVSIRARLDDALLEWPLQQGQSSLRLQLLAHAAVGCMKFP